VVIDYSVDWSVMFRGTGIRVEQTEWTQVDMRFEDGHLIVDMEANPLGFTRSQQEQRTVVDPSCVLVRNFPLSLRGEHFRNLCLCLVLSRVKCVNGALCVLATTDRAWLYAALLSVQVEKQSEQLLLTVKLICFKGQVGGYCIPRDRAEFLQQRVALRQRVRGAREEREKRCESGEYKRGVRKECCGMWTSICSLLF
jgi:hypothetical protein